MTIAGGAAQDAHLPYVAMLSAEMALQWLLGQACLLDAGSVFLRARYRQSNPKKITDAETGATVLVARVGDFGFIRLERWTYLRLGIAVVLEVVRAIRSV